MTKKTISIKEMQKFLKQHAADNALSGKEVVALLEESNVEQNFEKICAELETTEVADDDLIQQMKQLLEDPKVKEKIVQE